MTVVSLKVLSITATWGGGNSVTLKIALGLKLKMLLEHAEIYSDNNSRRRAAGANNESSDVCGIIKPGQRVKLIRSQAINVHKLLTIRYMRRGWVWCQRSSSKFGCMLLVSRLYLPTSSWLEWCIPFMFVWTLESSRPPAQSWTRQ